MHRPIEGARPLRVLVVGDSVGLTLGRGLELWAAETGGAQVRNVARMWCSLGRYADRGITGGSSPGCDDWGTRWAAEIDAFDPDVVVVNYTIWELVPRRLESWDDYQAPGDLAYDAWQLSEYRAAYDVLARRGAGVVWLTVPCIADADAGADAARAHLNDVQLRRLAALRPAVHVVDLDGFVCPGGAFSPALAGVAEARPDGAHFSDAGATAAARWLMPQILGGPEGR